jgi:hypothetical protein
MHHLFPMIYLGNTMTYWSFAGNSWAYLKIDGMSFILATQEEKESFSREDYQ